MRADIRKCPEDEIVPLFSKMTTNPPVDVKWDSEDNDCIVRFQMGKAKISYWIRFKKPGEAAFCTFEFYPGVDNIRFDGEIKQDLIDKLIPMIEYGMGQRVSDFFDLWERPKTILMGGGRTGRISRLFRALLHNEN